MIELVLERNTEGVLISCSGKGHAGYAGAGNDIVCSAVTILIRTAMQFLSEIEDIGFKSDYSLRGNINFVTSSNSPESKKILVFTGKFLEKGFSSLFKEYPDYIRFENRIVHKQNI